MIYPIDICSFNYFTIKFVKSYNQKANIYNLNFNYNHNILPLISSFLKKKLKIYYQKQYNIYGKHSILKKNINNDLFDNNRIFIFDKKDKIINLTQEIKHQEFINFSNTISYISTYLDTKKSKISIPKNVGNIEENIIYEWEISNYFIFKLIRNIKYDKCQFEIMVNIYEDNTLIEENDKNIKKNIDIIKNLLNLIYNL
tara:strand:- start:14325 stop:14921 length:597 start_codon:yes stop_codon:yes gene_type:complete